MVCPSPIASAWSPYAALRRSSVTKHSRGTLPIAARTRSSRIPRRRSCCSTIVARWARVTSLGSMQLMVRSSSPRTRGRRGLLELENLEAIEGNLLVSAQARLTHRDLHLVVNGVDSGYVGKENATSL